MVLQSMFKSMMRRSILFRKRHVLTFSFQAYFITVFVYGLTPSTTSTRMMAPSANQRALETSKEKSTWPGESIRLILNTSSEGILPASFSLTLSHSYFL